MEAAAGCTRVLFVPGDLLDGELGPSFLDRDNVQVETAADAATALQHVQRSAPQLVVFRSRQGEHSVARFCQQLRATAPDIRLLMVTDRIDERPNDADDAACDAHLVSPVDTTQLISTMAELAEIQQRSHPRVPVDVLVHMEGFATDPDGVDSALGNGVTISEDRMVLESNRQLPAGARGQLQFFLPGEAERMGVEAEVRLAVDEVRLLYVVDFVDLPPQHRTRIRRYVQSHTADPEQADAS